MMLFESTTRWQRARPGFTLAEVTMALAVLATTMALTAQLAMSSLNERRRADARMAAIEAAANLLEQAHARSWDELTADWAGAQKLPDYFTSRWPEGRLAVRVEPEAKRLHIKRVTVEIKWAQANDLPPVTLTSLVAAHVQEGKR